MPATAEELATWFFPETFLQQRPELRAVFANARPESARAARRAATVQSALDADVSAIAAPTLLLAGELDRVVPPGVTLSMAAHIRGARTAVLPGVGHATALQAPQLLAQHLVRFLLGDPQDKE